MIRKPKRMKRLVVHVSNAVRKLAADLMLDLLDVRYVLRRLQLEGLPFITKTLPKFSAYALACIESQTILNAPEYGLTSFKVQGGSPRFMRGLLLEAVSGSAHALYRIRQFCDYFYKLAVDFSETEISQAQRKYVHTDDEVGTNLDWAHIARARKLLHNMFPRLCASAPHEMFRLVRPHDGPGAFYESADWPKRQKVSWEEFKKLPTRNIGSHPRSLNAFSGYFKSYPSSKEVLLPKEDGRISRLLFVPKDSRGPRTICKEPYFLQKASMALGKGMSFYLERESGYRINFTSQKTNQELSERSSLDRTRATIDLKDASDRVPLSAVEYLSWYSPSLRFTARTRSTHVMLPDGSLHRLRKFASMGSGLCFPWLSLYVYLFAVLGVIDSYFAADPKADPRATQKRAAGNCYVYGDDLIVPTDSVPYVFASLAKAGMVVNQNKSFYKGFFRESCGSDFYHGMSVTPVRLKLTSAGLTSVRDYRNGAIPLTSDGGILQLERHCRELVDAGLYSLSEYYYRLLTRRLGALPFVDRLSPVLGYYDPTSLYRGVPCKREDFASYDTDAAEEPGIFIPVAVKKFTVEACPYKGLGRSFSTEGGLVDDFRLTPLRRSIKLKKRVPEAATLYCWGLTQV